MGIVRLNQLPDGSGNLTNDDIFLFMDDPSGSGITKKISLSEIASAVGGGNPFDQNLNTTDSPTFSGINLSDGVTFGDGSSQNTAPNPIDWTLIINSDNTVSGYNLTSIGNSQFSGNTGIGLRIGSVTSIGNFSFNYCYGFTGNLTIPNSVTSIGIGAFYNCFGFSGNLTIPNSVNTIGSIAFYYCYGLSGNLTIPNSVTSIGNGAFSYCFGLTNVDCYIAYSVFPNSNEFSNCTFSTFHVRSSDSSWTAGSTTLGGHTFTVIKDLV